jgi:flagellar assembly protein FliH
MKSARVVGDRYTIDVPQVEIQPARVYNTELDERFASPDGPLAFTGDEVLLEEPTADEPVRQPKVDWEAIRSEARGVIDRAAQGGEAMLRDAALRARELVANAQDRCGTIEAEARARGQAEGSAAGRTAVEAEFAQSVASLQSVIDEARVQRQKIVESAEPELVKLAMSIAERIVHEQISLDPNVVLENVRQALTRLVGREVVTLRVNPADLDLIRAHRDTIATANDVEHLRVVEDQRVDRGGVVVETDAGTIDAKVSTQIREARRTLLAEPSVFSPAQAS